MKRLILILLLLIPTSLYAQVLKSGNISTAGADCSVATACFELDNLKDIPSIAVNIDVATTGTFLFEYTVDNIVWRAAPEDIAGATSTTADGTFFFSNPGYFKFRVRASAINGTAPVIISRGYANLRSTATLVGGGGDGAIIDGVSAAIKATVLDLTNTNPVTTAIVDANGTQITSFGGGLTDTDDGSIAVSQVPSLSAALNMAYDGTVWRRITFGTAGTASAQVFTVQGIASMTPLLATLSGTNNINNVATINSVAPAFGTGVRGATVQRVTVSTDDIVPVSQSGTWTLQPGNTANTTPWLVSVSQGGNTQVVNGSGQASVVCANCSGSGVSQVDNTGFTPGTTVFVPMGGEVDDTGTTAATENNAGAVRMTVQRGLHANPRDNAGAQVFGNAAAGANGVSNPTLGGIFGYNMCWNGATWDRCPTATGGSGATDSSTTRTVTATDSPDVTTLGGTADAASTAGGTGSLSAKLRLITTQLDTLGKQYCADPTQVSSVVISGTADAQLVAISGSTVVYVCGFSITSAADVNARLISGTGSVCATGLTARTGTYQLTAASGAGLRGTNIGFGSGIVTKGAAGEAICLDVTAAVQVDGVLTYVQR